jgi:hypothetical protein
MSSEYVAIGDQCQWTGGGVTRVGTVISNPDVNIGDVPEGYPNQQGGEFFYLVGDVTPPVGNQTQVLVRASEVSPAE